MANINKIRVSGTTYDIQDSNAPKTVELTQAQYDALVTAGTVDPNTFYIITDATAGDLSNYYTKSETSGATEISTALGNKQDTLVSGTNIKTINNESILGSGNIDIQGGGKAVSGSTNISITTGETTDTINCTLPFEKINTNSVTLGGYNNTNRGTNCYISGHDNVINNYGSRHHIIGDSNKIGLSTSESNFYHTLTVGEYNINRGGVVFGRYNSSSSDALFSVGNGTRDDERHNAFEIRQNGDIYITKNGQDVKLQDQLGGGGGVDVDSAFNASSTNPVENRVIYNKIDEVEQVTAAGLNALNDNFGGLKLKKLTQAEYNAIATKDASTLYIIVN